MKIFSLILLLLAGCENSYRYACQNPDNFHKPECVKPRCLFTQQCPEYLVAPVLEKQANDPRLSIQTEPQAPASKR